MSLYTWTKTTPKFIKSEWLTFNRKVRDLLSLVCSKCEQLFEAKLFTDYHAKKGFLVETQLRQMLH